MGLLTVFGLIGVLAMLAVVALVVGFVFGAIELNDFLPNKDKDQKDWNRFDIKKPKESGWYLCTVEQGSRFNMLLYWDCSRGTGEYGRFVDPVRKSVFDNYEVMVTKKFEEGMETDDIMPNDEYMERIFRDEACDRTDQVIAWKPEPNVFKGEVKNSRNIGKDRASSNISKKAHLSAEDLRKLGKELQGMMNGKNYDLTHEDIDRIVSNFMAAGNSACSADELRSVLMNLESISIHNNGRKYDK